MADGEKVLGILYRARGAAQVAAVARQVESSLAGIHGRAVAFASTLKTGVGNALTTFGGRLKQAATGIAALAGIGGILSLGGVIESSVRKLEDFSLALEKVQTLTGETARDSGALILLFEKFGISLDQVGTFAGFAEKTLGKLNNATAKGAKATKSAALAELERQKLERQAAGLGTKKIDILIREQKATDALNASLANAADGTTKLQALDKQYGLALVDANGKTVSFSQELLQLADFYDRNHDAAQRAYVASTLLGRGYATLAPILDQGAEAIRQAAAEADALGLGSQNTADQIVKFRSQMRDLGVQANVLQLKIGMALVPAISHFASDLSNFITTHGSDITDFFRNAGTAAETFAGTVGDVVGSISRIWSGIPGPIRDLLITGVGGDRVIKFLFGFSPIGSIAKGIEGGFANAIGRGLATAGLGKLFVQPVFVTNPGFGGLGGAAGAAEGAAGGGIMGLLGAAGIAAIVLVVADQVIGPIVRDWALQNGLAGQGSSAGKTDSQLAYERAHQGTAAPASGTFHDSSETRAAEVTKQALIDFRAGERADWTASVNATRALTATMRNAPWLSKLEASWRKAGQTMHDKIKAAIAGLTGPHSGAAASFLGSHLGQAGFGAGGLKQAQAVIAALKALGSRDPAVIRAINRLTAQLPRLRTDAKDLAAAEKIAQGSDPKNAKLDALNRLMADLRAHGDRTAQKKLGDIIAAVKHNKTTINLKNSATTIVRISAREINKAQTTFKVYGSGSSAKFAF